MSEVIKDFINNEYEKRCDRNSNYSIRSFAKSLLMDASVLTRIMNGNRMISFPQADKILKQLPINLALRNSLLLTLSEEDRPVKWNRKLFKNEVQIEHEDLLKTYKWSFYALLCALEIECIKHDKDSLAEFLKVSIEEVDEIISQALRIGILVKQDDGYVPSEDHVLAAPDKKEAIIKAHRNHMEKAIDYMYESDEGKTSYLGMTFPMDQSKALEAERRIWDFAKDLTEWISKTPSENKDSVYRFNLQLFPLARVEKEDLKE